jgi:hypothetical protein
MKEVPYILNLNSCLDNEEDNEAIQI